jgi:hypothetical protein
MASTSLGGVASITQRLLAPRELEIVLDHHLPRHE